MPRKPHEPGEVDVLIVGAGQAGLVTGYFLRETGLSYVLYEHHPRIGDAWRRRYDTLVLFSPRAYSALPGLPLPGDPEGYPTKEEMADYLAHYAQTFRLPVRTAEGIARLERRHTGFVAHTAQGRRVEATAVIVATGALQQPIVPAFAGQLGPTMIQLTAATYRRPAQLPLGRVLVVGDGATGRQIAYELVPTHEVVLSTGKPWLVTPQRLLGKDSLWWFDALGALRADKDTHYGRWVRAHDAFPGWHLRRSALRRRGVRLVPRTVGADARQLQFAHGTAETFDAVIWAMGYRDEASWLQIPKAVDVEGNYIEVRGISPVPGLFYVGRPWQHTRASALLCGVGADAAKVVDRVMPWVRTQSTDVSMQMLRERDIHP